MLRGQAADPNALGGRVPKMYPRRAVANNIERHRFVVLALMDSQARSRAKREAGDELKKFRIFFVHAQNFVRFSNFRIRKPHCSVLPPQRGQPTEKRNAMRAAALASKAL